jgi:hypothetical protein
MTIPANVHSRILVKVREEWPDDFEMQKHTLDKQVNSYIELGRFYADLEPSDFINGIFSSALAEWPDDYDMQLHTVTKQIDAAVEFFQYENLHIPKDVLELIRSKAFAEWPDDYDMQLYTLKKQASAWLSLNGKTMANTSSERLPCPKCRRMMLLSTAAANDGLCALCYREEGHAARMAAQSANFPSTLPAPLEKYPSVDHQQWAAEPHACLPVSLSRQNALPTAARQPVAATTQTLPEVLAWLCTQNSVPTAVLRQKLLPLGLMPSAVMDDVNERAFDVVGESALDEAAGIVTVQRGVLLQVLAVW